MNASENRRWWALLALAPAVLAVALDGTILSVALPTLGGALRASTDALQWFVVSYSLVFAAAMIPSGMLGDRFGRKRVLLISLGIFGLGSVACAYAASAGQFIAARALLGVGAAAILPMVLSALPVLFSEDERPKAIAVIMSVTMLGFPIGPILGGWLLTSYWWGWVFLMNVPVVVLAVAAVALLVPETRSGRRGRLDLLGVVLSSGGLALLTYGVIEAGQRGWGDDVALAGIAAGIALLAAFWAWQRRVSEPLVDLRLFASPGFTWGTVLAAAVSFVLFGLLFTAPQYFQVVLGMDPQSSGIRLLPLIGGLLVGAGVATRLVGRLGQAPVVASGFALLAAGLALGATTTLSTGAGFALVWIAVCGVGTGFVLPTAMDAALGALSVDSSGVGSGVIQAMRMVGGSFGAAILGSVLNSAYRNDLDLTGLSPAAAAAVRDSFVAGLAVAERAGSSALATSVRSAFVSGMDATLWVSCGLAVACIVLAVVLRPRRRSARHLEPASEKIAA
jgi:EmrB/QacA subfamily drug resistance transporter